MYMCKVNNVMRVAYMLQPTTTTTATTTTYIHGSLIDSQLYVLENKMQSMLSYLATVFSLCILMCNYYLCEVYAEATRC